MRKESVRSRTVIARVKAQVQTENPASPRQARKVKRGRYGCIT